MEGQRRILRETGEEELQERIYVLACDWTVIDGTTVLDVRESYSDGLVEEYDVGIRVPAVGIQSRVLAVIGNAAGPKLEEKTRGGAAARATVKPHDDRRIFRRVSGLKEPGKSCRDRVRWTAEREWISDGPKEEVLVVGDIEVSSVLLDVRIAQRRLGNPQLIVGKVGVLDQLVFGLCAASAHPACCATKYSHISPCSCTKVFPSIHWWILAPALFGSDWRGLGASRFGEKPSPRTTWPSGIKDAKQVERKTRGSKLSNLIVVKVVVVVKQVVEGRQLSCLVSSRQ